jgi:glycerol-3-phosphate acyltransferase PlsY
MNLNPYIMADAMAYLLGSIPFGYLLVRIFTGEDVRFSGSGNIGATNVARKSPILGATTLVLDAAKGLAAVLLARMIFAEPNKPLIVTTAALFAVLGHLFPFWLKFRGGKGVATSLGAFLLITPKSIAVMVVLFVIIVLVSRYVSLGSVAVAAAFPVLGWALHEYSDPRELIIISAVALLVIWSHRANIARLLAGTESKLGAKREPSSGPGSETLGAARR